MTKFILACFFLFCCKLVIADYVPVIIWGPNIQNNSPIALKSHHGDEFIGILNAHITSDTIVLVITEDHLSIEDLSQCKAPNGQMCFQGIQQIKRKLYLPNVADPVQKIEDVAGINKIEVNLLSNGDISEPFDPNWGKYVFISLENINSDEIKSVKLSRHDQIIAKLYNQLSSQYSQVVVIFTGKSNEHQRRFAREIYSPEVRDGEATNTTKASSDIGIFWKGERFLLYYTALSTEHVNQSINIENMTVNATDEEVIVTLSRNNLGSNDTDNLEFTVYRAKGYWYVNNFTWNEETLMPNRRISAVDNFSFHCTPAIHLVTVTSDRTVKIIWKGLQLQPKFGSIGVFESFGDAWDCVGFVNPVGLAATLIAFVLLFILLIGFMCMLNIKTNDRFDDPKKVITFGSN